MGRTTIVYGPQGCGKTRHSKTLRAMFGCDSVLDDWDGRSPLPEGALVLTNERPPFGRSVSGARVVAYVDAMFGASRR